MKEKIKFGEEVLNSKLIKNNEQILDILFNKCKIINQFDVSFL